MTERAAILVVDDDALMLRSIARSMFAHFDISTAGSVKDAIEILAGEKTFAVIVADLHMPHGDGVELLQYVRARFPDMVRVMLSGSAQLGDYIAAVNEGHVFQVLTKPFELPKLRRALLVSVEQHRLLTSERVLLDETLKGSIKALTDLLALVQPAAFGRSQRMRQNAMELARLTGMNPSWDVEVAALLSQIGCVTLDADTLDRWYHCQELTPAERAQVDRLPDIAVDLIAKIPRLESVCTILRRQYDSFDTGDLPTGAAILAIARDFDMLLTEGKDPDSALSIMDARGLRYDAELMQHFRALRGAAAAAQNIEQMPLRHVREGMIFSADVYSAGGLLLIARGQHVTSALLSRLRLPSFAMHTATAVRMIVPLSD